ncbi:MAG: hypothetical protein CNF02_10520 [OM182 bacterium MED-G28]|uniref:Uncharacterized protein n=1 Tax=OM182 bacterium MED-G28 TaxID=1986256 RepID=A0A2A5W9D3_9GAMM|nr:MAG: hypothetical protein CNF02_10520 [OM182 bacterium MED-G28]
MTNINPSASIKFTLVIPVYYHNLLGDYFSISAICFELTNSTHCEQVKPLDKYQFAEDIFSSSMEYLTKYQ